MSDSAQAGWYYVGPDGLPIGPYDGLGLQGLLRGKYIHDQTYLWYEGAPAWLPLAEIVELKPMRDAVAGLNTVMAGAKQDSKRAGKAGVKSTKAISAADAELAAFQAEIQALDDPSAAPAAKAGADAGVEDVGADVSAAGIGDGPATPDELEFEDDDGTMYVWDHKLRKYIASGADMGTDGVAANTVGAVGGASEDGHTAADAAAAAGTARGAELPAYDPELMTFDAGEEVLPSLSEAKAQVELRQAVLRGDVDASALESGSKAKRKRAEADGADPNDPSASATAAASEGTGATAIPGAVDTEAADTAADAEQAGSKKKGKKGYKLKSLKVAPKEQTQAEWVADPKNNCSVYVTGLPDDVTVEEMVTAFTKCGIIKVDEKNQPKVKLYRDKVSGFLKGDGLVTYLKPQSVDLACNILDGAMLRANSVHPLSVTKAKFEMKSDTYVPKPLLSKAERRKLLAKQEKKALGWGGFDDKLPAEKVTVVLKHMYVPDDLAGEPQLQDELEDDVRAECSKLGPLDAVKLHRNQPDGVVTVKFQTEEAAHACVQLMNDRWFGGQQLIAHMWDGITNYNAKVKETEAEQAARLEAFSRELEAKRLKVEADRVAAGGDPSTSPVDPLIGTAADGDPAPDMAIDMNAAGKDSSSAGGDVAMQEAGVAGVEHAVEEAGVDG